MSGVGRYVKFTAQPGRGDELATLLLRAADSLRTEAGHARGAAATALLARPPERTDLEPLGGVGYIADGTGYIGPHHTGDAVIERDFWSQEAP